MRHIERRCIASEVPEAMSQRRRAVEVARLILSCVPSRRRHGSLYDQPFSPCGVFRAPGINNSSCRSVSAALLRLPLPADHDGRVRRANPNPQFSTPDWSGTLTLVEAKIEGPNPRID